MCDGTGHIKQSLVIVDEIESNLKYLATTLNEHRFTIMTHPYIAAYLTKGGLKSLRMKWMWRHHVRLAIKCSEQYSLLEYHFFNANGDEIQM